MTGKYREARQVDSVEAMQALAEELSLWARPGMVLLLAGELGSGKSTFARAFIRALASAATEFDIPSPTFTLVQAYDETRIPVAHADLYRITGAPEVDELDLEGLSRSHVLLIEWPDRLPAIPWDDVLTVSIAGHGTTRQVSLAGHGQWSLWLQRNAVIKTFLASKSWGAAKRRFFEGDASFRRYETLEDGRGNVILMDMPARPDGPPVKDGKSYSAIAHLAEDIGAVIAVNEELGRRGLSVPTTYAHDVDSGLAVIEDLGRKVYGKMILAGEDMREPLREAVAVLARMAAEEWPDTVPITGARQHRLSPYDRDAQLIEIDLLAAWFWPYRFGVHIPEDLRQEFAAEWQKVLPVTDSAKQVWVLRDYHSPNLLWMSEREGLRRVGIIDTQDAVLGHPAYDLASLLQDARVDVDFSVADELYAHYCALRQGPDFATSDFAAAYAVLGAQRATKILGIFARLSKRDSKHGYLKHLPRVSRYLERNLQHPVLYGLKAWYARHLPATVREEGLQT